MMQSPTAFSDMKEKFQQLAQLTNEAEAGLTKSLDLVEGREKQAALVESQFAEHQNKLTEAVGLTKKLKYQFDHIDEQDLLPNQLQTIAMLQKQIESLEDQVIDRDAALQEIESQMKQDYEQHDQLIRKLNFEVSLVKCCVPGFSSSPTVSPIFPCGLLPLHYVGTRSEKSALWSGGKIALQRCLHPAGRLPLP